MLFSVTYDDRNGWPLVADGAGDSIVLIPDAEDRRRSWRASARMYGSPGEADGRGALSAPEIMRIKTDLRYELKYLIRREQMERLALDLAEQMDPDGHGNELGQYPITSLYYDSPDYKAYWDKLDGHRKRRKVACASTATTPSRPTRWLT